MPAKKSFVTVTDQFCGAGGSSIGAVAAGAELSLALNHWKLAIESHQTNFPNAAHDCTDVSACDPRRYPSSDILITSPECTNHSLAKGRGRRHYKADLFGNVILDPAEERSRATMWDVPRFAEYHRYSIIIVENVVDARGWVMYDAWIHAMTLLGYDHQAVYFNSMFAWPTPQSRDRMYVVFWRRGNRAPDLDIRPAAHCQPCGRHVEAVQRWKNQLRRYGRYGARGQYVYCCPDCHAVVHPLYYPALTAIDWSLPIERIGDRARPLKEKTLARIRLGLERFKDQHLLVDANCVKGLDEPLATQVAAGSQQAVILPGIVELRNHGTVRLVDEALATVAAEGNHHALLGMPFLTRHYSTRGTDGAHLSRGVDEALGTVTSQDHHSLTVPFIASYYGEDTLRPVTDALGTQTGKDRHALVAPFVVSQYGGEKRNPVHHVGEPMMTVPGMALHRLAIPGETPAVEDCGFRMLEPHEIGRAMAFPDSYIVLGNKRERVKQFGNAVTPPIMKILIERCLATLG